MTFLFVYNHNFFLRFIIFKNPKFSLFLDFVLLISELVVGFGKHKIISKNKFTRLMTEDTLMVVECILGSTTSLNWFIISEITLT